MPAVRVDEIAGYVTVGRAADLLGVKMPRVHQLVEEGELRALALSTHADAKQAGLVLVLKASIEEYQARRGEHRPRGPKPGSGGRPRRQANRSDLTP